MSHPNGSAGSKPSPRREFPRSLRTLHRQKCSILSSPSLQNLQGWDDWNRRAVHQPLSHARTTAQRVEWGAFSNACMHPHALTLSFLLDVIVRDIVLHLPSLRSHTIAAACAEMGCKIIA